MKPINSPGITSFVIRFVYAESTSSPDQSGIPHKTYRGAIRHIQSDQEITFSSWQEAIEFIRRFVPLELDD
jgi:hypothetical protein